jgi:hypothetical protein
MATSGVAPGLDRKNPVEIGLHEDVTPTRSPGLGAIASAASADPFAASIGPAPPAPPAPLVAASVPLASEMKRLSPTEIGPEEQATVRIDAPDASAKIALCGMTTLIARKVPPSSRPVKPPRYTASRELDTDRSSHSEGARLFLSSSFAPAAIRS